MRSSYFQVGVLASMALAACARQAKIDEAKLGRLPMRFGQGLDVDTRIDPIPSSRLSSRRQYRSTSMQPSITPH